MIQFRYFMGASWFEYLEFIVNASWRRMEVIQEREGFYGFRCIKKGSIK